MSINDTETRKSLKKFDARKLMEIAIEEMKKSVSEAREDKVPPAVGAVIWFPNEKKYETAYRGELREGDHGEFTLLERKLGNMNLEDCILFTTLEPCMVRNVPKSPCARRITNARIKEVYVGIQDPDLSVNGEGLALLKDHGVVVHMFDSDLQGVIEQVNAEFIVNANKRKKKELEASKKSKLKEKAPNVKWDSVSDEAVELLHKAIEFDGEVDSGEFKELLGQLNMVDLESGNLTNNGVILFGEHPRRTLPQAAVLGTLELADGSEEVKDFDGPQVLVPEKFLDWIKAKIPNPIDRSGASRSESNQVFFELLREGLVNAIVHRDYEIEGAKIQVIVSPDSVVIKSPGGPFPPITLEQLQSFDSPMLSRNPVLHYVFNQLELAEERGLGLKSMRTKAQLAGLPLPKYNFDDLYLVLTIYRSDEGVTQTLDAGTLSELNPGETLGYHWLAKQAEPVSRTQYQDATKTGQRNANLQLNKFILLGIAEKVGIGPATKYRAIIE